MRMHQKPQLPNSTPVCNKNQEQPTAQCRKSTLSLDFSKWTNHACLPICLQIYATAPKWRRPLPTGTNAVTTSPRRRHQWLITRQLRPVLRRRGLHAVLLLPLLPQFSCYSKKEGQIRLAPILASRDTTGLPRRTLHSKSGPKAPRRDPLPARKRCVVFMRRLGWAGFAGKQEERRCAPWTRGHISW